MSGEKYEYQITAIYYGAEIRREVFVEAKDEEELVKKLEKHKFTEEWENEIINSGKVKKYTIHNKEKLVKK